MTVRTFMLLTLIACAFASAPVRAAEVRVADAKDVDRAAREAKPGDVLVMKDGAWKDQKIKFSAKGTADKPVTLRAATSGKVVMTGSSTLAVDGEHVVVSGLLFTDLAPGDGDLVNIKGTDNRVTDCAVISLERGGKWFHFDLPGQRNRVDHCYLEGHAPADVGVQVEVDKKTPNEHRIDHNHFGHRPPLGKNGGETIRIGYSHQSMSNSRTIVEENLFDKCDGEIEIISSKSCENVYRGNTFRDSEGCLTLRHGNRCVIDGNYFFGNVPADGNNAGKPTGGVRVIGEDHVVTNNYFDSTSGIAGGVIVLTTGQPKPELTGYWHITKATITGNTFVNNAAPCLNLNAGFGQKDRSLLPKNVTIADNVMLAPTGGEAKPLIVGKEGEGFSWKDNSAQQGSKIGDAGEKGVKLVDLKMSKGADGLWHREGEPARKFKPLTARDVGPTWRKPAVAMLAAAADEAMTIKNDLLTVTVDPATRQLTVRRGGKGGVERVTLCPEITNAGGLAIRNATVKDALGEAQAIEFASEGGVQRVWLYKDQPFVFTRATLLDAGATEGDLRNVTPVSFQIAPTSKTRLFGSDGLGDAGKSKASYTFIAAVEPGSNNGVVCGFVTHDRASGIVDAKFAESKLTVAGRSEYGVPPMRGHKEERGETFVLGLFDDARFGLEQFADVTAKVNGIKLPPPYSGYSTWYHGKSTGTTGALDAKRMAELAKFADENHLRDFGLDFLQIDDQWQVQRRDFTTHKSGGNAPYADGMKPTADTIKKHGFRAGLWLTPFGWQGQDVQDGKESPNRTVLKDHPDYFVKRQDGSVYQVRWAGDCLDMSNPNARKFLAENVARMTHDWGYKLLKIDGLWAGMACKILYPSPEYRDDGLGDAVFHDKTKTNVEVYRDGLKLVRESAGADTFLLGCNIAQNMRTLGASIGLVDAMRVGPDIKADWGAVVRCARPATWLYFLNGRVWHNDPDCLMLREPLTIENGQAWASWIAMSGQLNLVSEWLPGLPPERLDIYKRTLPNHGRTNARPVDLFEREMPRIWHLSHGEGDDRVDLVGLFNWNFPDRKNRSDSAAMEEPTTQEAEASRRGEVGPITVKLDPAQLGLAGDIELAGFDFWAREFVKPFKGTKSFELQAGSCKVLALRKRANRPQFVGTSRHVTQGLVDVVKVDWDGSKHVLRGRSKLVADDPYELRIVANGAKFVGVSASASAQVVPDDDNVRVTLRRPTSGELDWEVRFGPAQ